MSNLIIGYSVEKKKNPWPVVVAIIIILIALLLWYVLSGQNPPVEKKIVIKPTIAVPATVAAVAPTSTTTSMASATTTMITKAKPPQKMFNLKPTNKKAKILQKATAHRIDNHQPQQLSQEFRPGEKVYFFTTLQLDKTPQTIKHIWLDPNGKTYASVDLYIVSQPADTWSFISLPPGAQGQWKIRVAIEREVVEEVNFRVRSE